MPAIATPMRYRAVACRTARGSSPRSTPSAPSCSRATQLDNAQRALACELAHVRTQLAELRVVMWPRVDPKDIVHGFRVTHRGGPPPVPPVAPNAQPLCGKHLRSTALAVLARNGRPMTLVEIHRELHLNGYAIASRQPVKRLADSLGYEIPERSRCSVDRAVVRSSHAGSNPGEHRRIGRIAVTPRRALRQPGRVLVRRFGRELDAVAPAGAASSSARLAWCTSSAAPRACVG